MHKLTLAVVTGTLLTAGCSSGRNSAPPATEAAPPVTAAPPAPAIPSDANPAVGGATMLPSRTIVANASAAPTLTTLVAAVTAADLVATLSGPGPFTVFAPTNDAFARLAPGTVDKLLLPQNRASLVKFLTYHVVPGTITSADLIARIAAGGGTATLVTIEGEPLKATMTGSVITLTSVTGNQSYIEIADVRQSNGMVHVVNGVLVPTLS